MPVRKLLLSIAFIPFAIILSQKEAAAVADGNGVCSAPEAANFDCANFGGNAIEFRGAFPSTQCPLSGGGITPCTVYFYRYTGTATNQVNVLLRTKLTVVLDQASEIRCSQYITGGGGDPTTGFGKNILTLGVCRIANNLANLPPDIQPPSAANVSIAVDPSTIDPETPLSWQVKQGNHIFPGSIVGPFALPSEILETEVTLKARDGASVSYANLGGNIELTSETGRIVPVGGTKLCIVNPEGDQTVPYTDPAFPSNWTCETITFATEQCDIKTDGGDPCRFIGGTCIKY